MMAQAQVQQARTEGKKLVVEKLDFGFRFYVEGNEKSWLVSPHSNKPTLMTIRVEKDRRSTDVLVDSYFNIDAVDICQLFMILVLDPNPTFEKLTGEKVEISEVSIIDYSRGHRPGFESCSFYDSIRPKWYEWVDSE